jgi:4-amino-4-deoxy-L-arabinose transferase-like glycosyltransferase
MVRKLTFLVIFLVAFSVITSRIVRVGGLNDPPTGGDERDYEALAFNIWKGNGFGFSWSGPEWQAPYLRVPASAGAVEGHASGYYPTTYRPPAFPTLWALTHAVMGRNFGAIRILNAALMAGAVALAALVALEFAGIPAAVLATVMLLRSTDVTLFARERQAEALATFFVSLLTWIWVSKSGSPLSLRAAAVSGAVLGLLILSRSNFVFFLPLAALIPVWTGAKSSPSRWIVSACLVLACLLVVAPWWTRNIVVTGAFLPTGSQGHINLPAGFSQRALDNEGRWRSNYDDGGLEASGIDPYSIEYEVRLAEQRFALAVEWMRANPRATLNLMGLHVWQEFRVRRGRSDWTLLLPATGLALVFFRRHSGTPIVALMLAAMLLSIALTWGSIGKFIVPVYPIAVAIVAAMSVATVVSMVRALPAVARAVGRPRN